MRKNALKLTNETTITEFWQMVDMKNMTMNKDWSCYYLKAYNNDQVFDANGLAGWSLNCAEYIVNIPNYNASGYKCTFRISQDISIIVYAPDGLIIGGDDTWKFITVELDV